VKPEAVWPSHFIYFAEEKKTIIIVYITIKHL